MKKLFFIFVAVGALVLASFALEANASSARKQRATMRFDRVITVHGVVLTPGQYLFVHDDAAMARGDACTLIYKGESADANKLVVSFHCIPAERTKATHFVTRSAEKPGGVVELLEFQFKGDTEAHLVPAS
ncbi:MAG TPA: hypothetical protein VLA93_22065 [Pyrinomonadaceae bacterium]|nr:hypothetical protein [Pyrinomonadaceae bacterium]